MKNKPNNWNKDIVLFLPWEEVDTYTGSAYQTIWVLRNSDFQWGGAVFLLNCGRIEFSAINSCGYWGEYYSAINLEEAFSSCEKEMKKLGWVIYPAKLKLML